MRRSMQFFVEEPVSVLALSSQTVMLFVQSRSYETLWLIIGIDLSLHYCPKASDFGQVCVEVHHFAMCSCPLWRPSLEG